MSATRGSAAAVVQPIPAGSRKVVQSLKEIVNCPDAEIYAALKECNMDPNEAVNRLLSQDPFHEVKSKREKKKEGKDNFEPKSRSATNSSNRGSKSGADRHLGGRGASASYYTSDPPLHGRSTYKRENGSGPHTSSVSSVSGNNRSRGHQSLIDDAPAGSKGTLLGDTNGMAPVAQPASGHQPAWVGVPGQMSMADIVRRGKPNTKGLNAPNASHHSVDWPTDDANKIHQSEVSSVPTKDEWPSIEKPPAAANVVSAPKLSVEPDLHEEAPGGVSYENINYHFETEEVQEEEDDSFEISGGNDVGSGSISNRMIPEDDSRGASLFENELYKNMGSFQSDVHNSERHEVDDFDASVAPVTRNLQQLSVNTDDRECTPEENAPSVVIPDHLQVQTADCSHLSFGSFGSFGAHTSVLEKPNSEEAHDEADKSSSGPPETRDSEYYVDDSLRNTSDGSLLHRNGAGGVGSYEASSAPQAEELRPESADVAGADRHLGGRGASASYYTSDPPLHGRSAYKKENGSGPHTSSVSSVSGNNRSRGHPGFIDDAPAGFYFMDFIQFRFFILKFTRVKKKTDMELVRMVVECVSFVCNFEFWRMAVLWTLSLVFSYFKLFFQRICSSESKYYHRFSPAEYAFPNSSTPMPVCVITGASSGLGAAAAYALSMEGFYVVLVGRSSENLSKAISDVKSRNHDACLKAFEVDLSSFKSIHEFKDSLQQWLLDSKMHSSIQLLVNNAGIFATSRRFTSDGYDQMLATNYIGPFCLTKLLLPLLENSPLPSRIINVTSFTHRNICCMQADRETVSGMCFTKSKCYPYAHIYEYSKLCLLLFSYELHRQAGLTEKSRHVSVVAVDPGAVKTNIMREVPPCVSRVAFIGLKLLGLLQCPETGVSSIVDAALASPEVSGVYFFGGKGRCLNSSALSYDSRLAKDLWATSCNLFQEMQAET